MTVLTRRELDEYDARLEAICDAAADAAGRAYDEMRRANLNASVADVREAIKAILEAVISSYGDAACELAAQLYDELAERSGSGFPPAELPDIDEAAIAAVDRRSRYLVRVLVDDREDI